MKIKKLIPFFLIAPVSLFSTSPINVQNSNNISTKNESTTEDKWNIFIEQKYVQSILNRIYKSDDTKKNEYIQSQKDLGQEYSKEIKKWLYFGNNVAKTFDYDGKSFWNSNTMPYALKQAQNKLNELYKKNWLWFLFNLENLEFAYYPQFDQFQGSSANIGLETQENALKLSSFYTPKSNQILDYAVQIQDYDESKNINYFLLTNEGFIIDIEINDYNDPEYDDDITISAYLSIYSAVINKKNIKDIFNINKYVLDSKDFYEVESDKSREILFKEHYGGSILRFTLYDIKIDN